MHKDQKEALTALHTGDTVQVFPDTVAKPLIDAGFARRASVDPTPKSGTAINITSAGRGALLDKSGKLPEPVDTATGEGVAP